MIKFPFVKRLRRRAGIYSSRAILRSRPPLRAVGAIRSPLGSISDWLTRFGEGVEADTSGMVFQGARTTFRRFCP